MHQISVDQNQSVEALNQLFLKQSLDLDYNLLQFLSNTLKTDGRDAFGIILNNLFKIIINSNHGRLAVQLAREIIRYNFEFDTLRTLFNWCPNLINDEEITSKICIEDETQRDFYQKEIIKQINDPRSSDRQVCDLIICICINSKEHIGLILPILTHVRTKINLDNLVKYLVENQIGLQELFDNLKTIGRLTPNSSSISKYLILAFPNNSVEAVLRYLEAQEFQSYQYSTSLELLASNVTSSELGTLIQRVGRITNQPLITRTLFMSLLSNSKLTVSDLFTSKHSDGLYFSAISYIDNIARSICPASNLNIMDAMFAIISDKSYSKVSKDMIRNLIYAICDQLPSAGQVHLKLYFLYKTPLNLVSIYKLVNNLDYPPLEPKLCKLILDKCVSAKSCEPLDDSFMLYLLKYSDQDHFISFIKNNIYTLLASKTYEYQNLLKVLAEENPHDFGYLFIRNSKKLMKGFSKYDTKINQVKSIAWQNCNWKQRIFCIFSL